MPEELQSLDELAARFAVDLPPAGSSWEARGAFLKGALDDAGEVAALVAERTGVGLDDEAIDLTAEGLAAEAARVLAASLAGTAVLTEPVRLARLTLAQAIVAGYAMAARGATLFAYPSDRAEAFRKRSDMGPATAADDYRRRLGMASAINSLASTGVLDLVFSTGGRRYRAGATPWIAIAAVGALAALAYVAVHFYEVQAANEKWRVACLDDAGNVIPEYRDLCVELAGAPGAGWWDKIAGALPWVAAGVLLIAFAGRR